MKWEYGMPLRINSFATELQEKIQKSVTLNSWNAFQKAMTPSTYIKPWRIGQNRIVSFTLFEIV